MFLPSGKLIAAEHAAERNFRSAAQKFIFAICFSNHGIHLRLGEGFLRPGLRRCRRVIGLLILCALAHSFSFSFTARRPWFNASRQSKKNRQLPETPVCCRLLAHRLLALKSSFSNCLLCLEKHSLRYRACMPCSGMACVQCGYYPTRETVSCCSWGSSTTAPLFFRLL